MAHRLAPEARTDLDDVWWYVANAASAETADRLVDAITARFLLLSSHAWLGRRRDDLRLGLRLFPVGEYVIFYRIDGADVLIQRVVRGARDITAFDFD